MRIALGIEYDGTAYHGWQRQQNGISVQQVLEEALSRVADSEVLLHCAGRTDTGVHATQQVVHFDSEARRSERNWVLGANANLPRDVSVRWARQVGDDFHARFSAESRRYRYVILSRFARSALWANRATWTHKRLDGERMQRAAQHLVGRHDFSSYRAVHCQAKSPVRTLHSLAVSQRGGFTVIDVHGDGFLHHMVRNIAGVLMAIGAGEAELDWSREVLEHRDRRLGGVTAPPRGLYFVHAAYPERFELPNSPRWPELGEGEGV
ncbi:MAG: tRNA pseudouridine(38-40) synthase TruA [Pseudomonadota bacterium]